MHLILTKWLALQAGFSEPDATLVAEADQACDEGKTRPAIAGVVIGVSTIDVATLRQVQRYHFPSDPSAYPGPPAGRAVEAGGLYAREALERVLRAPPYNPTLDLKALGDALHPFQDSWSHGKISDTPFRPDREVSPDLTWSHPALRHGWDRHDADLTAVFPQDAVRTAAETWKALDRFAERHFAPRARPTWTSLQRDAYAFISARGKAAKLKWITTHRVLTPERAAAVVDQLDAPGPALDLKTRLAIEAYVAYRNVGDVPAALMQKVRDTFDALFRKYDVGRVVAEAVDAERMRDQFGGKLGPAEIGQWARKFLTSMLIADHGLVNQLGHGNPFVNGYDRLPEQPATSGPYAVRPPALEVSVGAGSVQPVPAQAFGTPGTYEITVRLQHAPHDEFVFIWGLAGREWRIVRMLASVF